MLPVRFAADPVGVAALLAAIAAGIGLGTVSGLVPGLHANTLALLLAATAGSVPGPRVYVGAAMLSAGVTHTFLDVVPALALGVPDPAMAAGACPVTGSSSRGGAGRRCDSRRWEAPVRWCLRCRLRSQSRG